MCSAVLRRARWPVGQDGRQYIGPTPIVRDVLLAGPTRRLVGRQSKPGFTPGKDGRWSAVVHPAGWRGVATLRRGNGNCRLFSLTPPLPVSDEGVWWPGEHPESGFDTIKPGAGWAVSSCLRNRSRRHAGDCLGSSRPGRKLKALARFATPGPRQIVALAGGALERVLGRLRHHEIGHQAGAHAD